MKHAQVERGPSPLHLLEDEVRGHHHLPRPPLRLHHCGRIQVGVLSTGLGFITSHWLCEKG